MRHSIILRAASLASLCAALGCSWEWDRYVPGAAPVDASVVDTLTTDVVGTMDTPDAATTVCANDEECGLASSERPVCDTVAGRCVACTVARDVCGDGRYCTADHTCAAGCRDDDACLAMTSDAGAPDAGAPASHCDPATHACVQCLTTDQCPVGTRCLDRACVAGCDAARGCPADRTCCGGACVDTAADPNHCGVCGSLCTSANGVPACVASRCGVGRCNEPFGDCDGDPTNGCEANTQSSVAHCGGCGRPCAERPNTVASCASGACSYACAMGYGDCDGDPTNGCETDVARSLTHCGRCASACTIAGGTAACVGGVCTRTACATGRGDCDGDTANGCEVDLLSDANHCRLCSTACLFSRGSAVCVAGACAIGRCDTGFDNCDGDTNNGCETTLATSVAHCGACGRSCAFTQAAATCVAGACVLGACSTGAGNCDGVAANGCEVDTTTSITHCGGCGRPCPTRPNSVPSCAAGVCGITCLPGFGNCDGNALNGCETDVRASSTDCGACGRACAPANGTGTCAASACTVTTCNPNYADCDGLAANGCETEPVANNQHCGACGNVCTGGRTCVAGRCSLPTFAGYSVGTSPMGVDWIEACSLPGMTRILANQDDAIERGILPFPVEFWGSTNFTYFVSSNGWVGFGDYYANITALPMTMPWRHYNSLPRAGTPLPAAYVFGIDLVQGSQGVCVAVQGAAPNRRFVVQSSGAQLYDSSEGTLDPTAFAYELIAYESAGYLDMVFNTPFMSPGGTPVVSPTNVTVGLQDFRSVTSPRGVNYVGTVTPTTRVRFTPL